MTAADQPALVRRLLNPATHPHPAAAIRLVETNIWWVFLTGLFAYKVKEPVDLGFLDVTTPETLSWLCAEEVRGPSCRGKGPRVSWRSRSRQP